MNAPLLGNPRPSTQIRPNPTLQLFALLFLLLGAALGAALGYKVGAVNQGGVLDLTVVSTEQHITEFNWLFFEIGAAAGLVSCCVLLAASWLAGERTYS